MEKVVIHSEVLGEDRPMNIIQPLKAGSGEPVPVVYVLDGNREYVVDVAHRMHAVHPGLLVVGVENVDRSRDMFPEVLPQRRNTGGGGKEFLDFITTELVPHIDANYSAHGLKVLAGQSNSGFFALYAMLESPHVFDAYLSSSPMIGWDWDMISSRSRELLEGRKSFGKILFMNRGTTDLDNTIDYLPRYVELLEEISPRDFRWTSVVAEGEGHVPDSSYSQGIAFIFDR